MDKSLRHLLGQCLTVGISGTKLTSDEKTFLVKNNIGGVVLFGRNVESPQQLHALVSEIHSLRFQLPEKTPFFVGIDMEGGRVARLKAPFTQWPPAKRIGDLDSPTLAFKYAESMGKELRAFGINLDFAPCTDTLVNPSNKVIGDRSFGADPELVGKLASAAVRGLIKSDVIPCAKHFPGHGNVSVDSHEALPVDESTLADLQNVALSPFKKAFRARLDLVMTAHIRFPKIDPDWPATLSPRILQDILRKELSYRNWVVSDDLDMKALRNHYSVEQIAVQAMKAGINMLLYCNEPTSPVLALDALEKATFDKILKAEQVEASAQGLIKLKKAKLASPDPLPFDQAVKVIGHPEHLALSKAIETGQIPEGLAT